MEYTFAERNSGYELTRMASLVNKNPGTTLCCILVASDPYTERLEEFFCLESSHHDKLTALKDFARAQKSSGKIEVNNIHVCLIMRQIDSLLDLSAWVSPAYELDFGQGNVNDLLLITFLERLNKQDIELFFCQGSPLTDLGYPPHLPSKEEWEAKMEKLIWDNFSFEAGNWLLKSWIALFEKSTPGKPQNYTSSTQNPNALNYFFLQEQSLHNPAAVLTTMAALVAFRSDLIVGCLLFSDVPENKRALDPFQGLDLYPNGKKVDRVIDVAKLQQNQQAGYFVNLISACLIVREQDSVFNNLHAWVYEDFSLECRQGKVEDLPIIQFLKLLEVQNIKFHILPGRPSAFSYEEWKERMKPLISDALCLIQP